MYPRTNYEMTQADLDAILEACSRPAPVISFDGIHNAFPGPQENANRAWSALGAKMGFDYMTVQPIDGKGQRFFTAVPSENDAQRSERLAREDEEKKRAEVKRLESVVAEAQAKLAELLK